MQQAIIWTNADPVQWHIYAALDMSEDNTWSFPAKFVIDKDTGTQKILIPSKLTFPDPDLNLTPLAAFFTFCFWAQCARQKCKKKSSKSIQI